MKTTVLVLALAPVLYANTQYTYTSQNYSSFYNYSACNTGPCANFTSSMAMTLTFSVATALAPNLSSQQIVGQVTSFTASDGLTTFNSSDPNVRVWDFTVSTNATGHVTQSSIVLELWRSGTSPHSTSNRIDLAQIVPNPDVYYNTACESYGSGPAGMSDTCAIAQQDNATGEATALSGTWSQSTSQSAIAAPTLGEWGEISLSFLLLLAACWQLSRRTAASRG